MLSEAYIGLLGVGLGALIGLAGHGLDIFHSKKQRIREKKEDTYLKAIDIMTRYSANVPKYTSDEGANIPYELMLGFNNMKPSMTIYGTEEIYKYFTDSIFKIIELKKIDTEGRNKGDADKTKQMFEEFSEMILKDLNK